MAVTPIVIDNCGYMLALIYRGEHVRERVELLRLGYREETRIEMSSHEALRLAQAIVQHCNPDA